MSNTVKTKFAGLLRGLLRRFDGERDASQTFRSIPTEPSTAPRAAMPEPNIAITAPTKNADEIQLPLQSVLATLPMELRAKVVTTNTVGMTISLPVEKALAQLATGSVKISFGELRRLAKGVFTNSGGEYDAKLVTLPLNQILAQINPTLLARRTTQKYVEDVSDISGPFDARGHGLTISTAPLKGPAAAPSPRFVTPVPPMPAPMPRTVTPSTTFLTRAITPTPATNGSHASPSNGNGMGSNGSHKSVPPVTPVMPTLNAAPHIPMAEPVLASLAALSESWPEALRMEIAQLNLTSAQVALPGNLVEPALKRGRVIFSWRYVRSWIKPTPPPNVSVHDGVELELPLKVLAPLFFSQQKTMSNPRKIVSVAEEIPNLFFGFPQPQTEARIPASETEIIPRAIKPVADKVPDTNFYTFAKNGETPKTEEVEYRRPLTPATDFLSRQATPKEVVARAMALPGVAGALVALPDGLMVASHIPSDLNADTLAAFLPQIFERVSQSTKELRMGALNNVHFTVGQIPWKIFRVNAVYFAAFGRAGETLPTRQLAAMATELDRKKPQ